MDTQKIKTDVHFHKLLTTPQTRSRGSGAPHRQLDAMHDGTSVQLQKQRKHTSDTGETEMRPLTSLQKSLRCEKKLLLIPSQFSGNRSLLVG